MLPSPKLTKFTYELKQILDHFSKELNSDIAKTSFPRLHRKNVFNLRFSDVLDTYSDIETITNRLTKNIQSSMTIGGVIHKDDQIDQSLYQEEHKLTLENKTDLKSLYIFTKIFLDKYTLLLSWIFNWRGVENTSITKYYTSLQKYPGSDTSVQAFKDKCLGDLKEINDYITHYRDKSVVHNADRHKQNTEWFVNEMNGSIKFEGGGISSITPQEILFLTVEYVDHSSKFCIQWLSDQISSEPQALEKGLSNH